MTPTLCRLAPALAAALLSARAAHAAAPWEGPPLSADPAAIRAAADALASPRGAPLDVLLEEGVFRIDARGAVAQTYRVVYRPMSAEAARASARVERAWAPWREERPEIRARVVGADGAVATLEPGALAEAPVADGTGTPTQRRELSGIIPGVRSGAVVEQITAVRESAPPVAGAEVHRFRVGSPARLVRLTIEAPAGTALRWIVHGAELTPVETVAGGVRTLVFERRDAAPIPPREPFAPRELAPAPYVAFAAGQSWADVAGRVRAVFEGAIAGADLRAEVRAALGTGRPGREEKVRRIAAWLRGRVRATGVGIDEAPLAPTPPTDVLARGAGDAKDLAALLTALLRAAGLEADVALAASEWHDPPREVPGLGQLDHALVRVGGKGAPIWIDPSAAQLAPGTLPLDAQGKLALVAARRTRDLVRTPASGPADNAALTVRELHLAGLGRGRVVETRELGGLLAASERELRARVPLDHRDRLDERYAREALRADVFLGADVRGLEDPAAPFRVRVEAEGSALAETGDDEALVPVGAAPVLEPLSALLGGEREGAAPAPRRDDLELALPYRWEIRYRIFPPDGFRARRLPEGAVERFGPATLTRRYAAGEDGSVTASYLLDTGGRRLAAAEADALAARVRAAAGGEPDRIAFERTAAALLEDGQVKEALAELRRLSAAHPREAMHPLHLALSLLELGDQEGAAAEARRAIGLEPGRAWGHRVLGWILEHDAVGRRFGHGFDRAGAIAAYRRAAELDPGHAGGRAALAELLSRNGAGVRFGPGADLDAALAEYAALRADAGPGPHDTGLLATLLAGGHHADAAAIAREVAPSPERNAAMLAAAAVLGGPHRAQVEAEALGDDGGPALRQAAVLLARERRLPLAAALLRAAARGARDAADLTAFAELLASVRPWREAAADGDEAARLVKSLVVAAVASREPARAVEPLLSSRAVGPARAALLGGLPLPLGAVERALREAGVTSDLLLDVALSGLELFRDGDPATGLRVRLRFAFAPGEAATALFLVREGGALRLLASDAAWPILAAEARRAADGGDVAGAGRWLAWAREAVPGSEGEGGAPAGVLAAIAPPGAPLDLAHARLAAAALAAFVDGSAPVVDVLSAAVAAGDPPARRAALFALAQAHRSGDRPEAALAAADALLAEDPSSREAFVAKAWALRRLRRGAELDRAADALLARRPDDANAIALLATSRLLLGDRDGAARAFRRLVDGGRATPGVYNDAAWLALFRGGASAEALGWARRAVDGAPREHAALNTLATVLAELDRPAEARDVFLRSIEDGGPLEGADWYVQGRIAEAWKLTDAARAAYARVRPDLVDGVEDPSGAHVLARRRLGGLGEGPPKGTPPASLRR